MSHPALYPDPVTRTALTVAPRAMLLLLAAALCAIGGMFLEMGLAAVALLSAGGGFAALALITGAVGARARKWAWTCEAAKAAGSPRSEVSARITATRPPAAGA